MTNPSLWYPVFSGVVVGVIVLLAQYYLEPRRDRRKLLLQEGWKSKKEAFMVAAVLVDEILTAQSWEGPDVPIGHSPSGREVSSLEINRAYAALLLSAENPAIPRMFISFIQKGENNTPAKRGEFLIMLRAELYTDESRPEADMVPWVF